MSLYLQCILILISLCSFIFVVRNIRKSKVKLDYTFFWILFSIALLILSSFPKIADIASKLIGIQSPVTFILVSIIFLLLYKCFTHTMQISKWQEKTEQLTQHIACKEKEENDNSNSTK